MLYIDRMFRVADARSTWHGRWDHRGWENEDEDNDNDDNNEGEDEDNDGHEEQAEGWANRAHNILKRRGFRNIEYVSSCAHNLELT